MVSLCAVIFSLLVYQGGKGRPGGNSVVAVYFISSLDSEFSRGRRREREKRRGRVEVWGGRDRYMFYACILRTPYGMYRQTLLLDLF